MEDETEVEAVMEFPPLDMSGVSAPMLAALSKAQGQMATVGKDAKNSQRGYKYASADAMMAAVRKPLAANGLAFISTWERIERVDPSGSIGNQFVCATVRMHFALTWSDGKEKMGMIRGTAVLDAIGSAARPPDKAVAATLTYMRGFVLREILNIDRGEDPDDIDQRTEGDYKHSTRRQQPRQQQQQQQRTSQRQKTPTEIAFGKVLRQYQQEEFGRDGIAPPWQKTCVQVSGIDPWPDNPTEDQLKSAIGKFEAKMGGGGPS